LLAEDVVFASPVVHTPQRGKAITLKYLSAALYVLFNETFRYVGEWRAARSAVLEFVTTMDGVEINGVDIIDWNEDGRIVQFKVMARPLKGINLHGPESRLTIKSAAESPGGSRYSSWRVSDAS
jgi:hypothetical protein